MRPYRPLLAALAVMALLTPGGLYFPEIMKAGGAWGEWSVAEIRKLVGYAPREMERSAQTWKPPMPGYALPGQGQAPLRQRGLAYALSAVAGVAACGGLAYLVARRRAAPGRKDGPR